MNVQRRVRLTREWEEALMTGDKPGGPARRAITLTGGALAILVMTFTPLASQAELKLAAVGGLDQPCAADGICNAAVCEADPDCPKRLDTSSTLLPRALVNTTCGGKLWVEATNSLIGAAAATVHHAYPNFNMAQSSKNPSFFDAHPSGIAATGHGELKGFGVTMVQGKWPRAIESASGELNDPSLLFFHKADGGQDGWNLIGMGYSFEITKDGQDPPATMRNIPSDSWFIHEAGYHHSPGDGGFTCACNDDLKGDVFDAGKRVDPAGCTAVRDSDIKTREFHVDKKHGRYWATHVWFEPTTLRPTFAKTDPWCRQAKDALTVPACAFFTRGSCP